MQCFEKERRHTLSAESARDENKHARVLNRSAFAEARPQAPTSSRSYNKENVFTSTRPRLRCCNILATLSRSILAKGAAVRAACPGQRCPESCAAGYLYIYIYTYAHTHVCIRMCMCLCACACACVCVCACMHVSVSSCTNVCMYVCMYACVL